MRKTLAREKKQLEKEEKAKQTTSNRQHSAATSKKR